MAILCQAGGQFFITFSLPKIKASFGSIGLLMQPIIATIFGIIWFPLKRFLKKRKEKKEKHQNKVD